MGKPVRLIEYQNDKQRTPQEALDYVQDEIDKGNVTHMVVMYRDDKFICHVSASEDRKYSKSDIFWDVTQWLNRLIG